MKHSAKNEFKINGQSNYQIRKREKYLEISVYVLIIIVTVAFMLIFFNLF